ncbi:MAG: hypothetical protein BRD45_03925 [Bacteroidetes bacterium QS_8_64_10]|jgi:predicted transcriptional regulator|nr:MAG: hypothetical protein BRD45_03925 [Bacteroidetes bacterium QS_8_64_10]
MRVTVNVPDELGEQIKMWADEQDVSVSSIYADAVEKHLARQRRKRAAERIEASLGGAFAPDALEELDKMREGSERHFE